MKSNSSAKPAKKHETNWDAIYKVCTTLVAVSGLAFAVYQYRANAERTRIEEENKAWQATQNQRAERYRQLSISVTAFSQESTPERVWKIKSDFLISLGELRSRPDTLSEVAEAINKFADAIRRWEETLSPNYFLPPSKFTIDEDLTFDKLASEICRIIREKKLLGSDPKPTSNAFLMSSVAVRNAA